MNPHDFAREWEALRMYGGAALERAPACHLP